MLDVTDHPHFAYRDGGGYPPFGYPMYAREEGGGWANIVVDGSSWVSEGYTSLALDGAGRPRIAYIGGGTRYAAYDGTNWSTETVDPSGVAGTSLQLDAAGRPHISYVGATGLSYAVYDGAAWAIALVDPAATDNYTSLDLDRLGRPHIAYLAASKQLDRHRQPHAGRHGHQRLLYAHGRPDGDGLLPAPDRRGRARPAQPAGRAGGDFLGRGRTDHEQPPGDLYLGQRHGGYPRDL
ncbi:MAG: hypothetical protein ACP5NB_12740 [Chloroflexia bacterium]